LEEGGFGKSLGNDVTKLQRAVEPCRRLLEAARQYPDILVIHTREGHRSDLSDVHGHKNRNNVIGSGGPMGRILIRGEPGHDIIEALYPQSGEPIIDKPGKGSFYATDLECILHANDITTLLVCGVTTEVCVHTTVREANDRGFHCIVIKDACASYDYEFHEVAIRMITAQGGIFGSVTRSIEVIEALTNVKSDCGVLIDELGPFCGSTSFELPGL
jgi:nicotinamidase-related amidase